MTEIPVFGARVEGRVYRRRPSAYVIIHNSVGDVAMVRMPKGVLLPGGGIDRGETAEQAATREAREETGLVLTHLTAVGDAIEFIQSHDESEWYEKVSAFFSATPVGSVAAEEPDHELIWTRPELAIAALSPLSHRWAMRRYAGFEPTNAAG